MQPLQQLCVPRPTVFDSQRRDTVLDIGDLVNGRIDPATFFSENYITEGMKTLLEQGFRRLEGKSNQGIFKLRQAMGGGKTHNLLALGLLAQYPEFRAKVMGDFYQSSPNLGSVKVVAFSGRESDAPFGIWGAIADQLGKRDVFKDLYSPPRAPGQTAWENLLAGERVLILLDELPPYFEQARSVQVGNSDLAVVSATALSNLLVALGRESCSQVCLVITDLTGVYETGTQQISTVLSNLEKETHRSAMTLEPVRLSSDEFYQILRKRLFENLPEEAKINEVAQAYAQAIREARQMDITNESPEQFASRLISSYPFHPGIRDLYARFRENPGFQQTRGLIRLMRIVTSRLWNSGLAEHRFLITAQDLDFNDSEILAEVNQINNSLGNAIAHDIASRGTSEAERLDQQMGGCDAQDVCRLLLVASLSNVPHAVLGLSLPEIVAFLAEPGRNVSRLKTDVLSRLATSVWYMHSDRDGRLFFRNVQNLNAKLENLVQAYQAEQAVKELRIRLKELFQPNQGWCYQNVLALPAVDEIELDQDRVTLVIVEPTTGAGLKPEIRSFYDNATWQNRVAFLSGPRSTYDQLIEIGKRLKAIENIQSELKAEKTPNNDPQMIQANDLADKTNQNFRSAVRETFTTLWFPLGSGLSSAEFQMRFEGNLYQGEQQIVDVLKDKAKFTQDITGDIFRQKCETRLFTQQSLPWIEIKRRAAANNQWQWHHPRALDDLKTDSIQKDIWREDGGYVDKGPFPAPKTSLLIKETDRNDDTGEMILKITPVNADNVYYDIGSQASTASSRLEGAVYKTSELRVSFLAVDSTGGHEMGDPVIWENRISLKHRQFQAGDRRMMELKAAPEASIRYTTNGSDPKLAGALYDGPFAIPQNAPIVLAYAERDGICSPVERIQISWDRTERVHVNPKVAAVWKRRHGFNSTKDSYAFLDRAKQHSALCSGLSVTIKGEGTDRDWVEINMNDEKRVDPSVIEESLSALRKLQPNGQVLLSAEALHFQNGQDLLDWVEEARITLQSGEVKQ